MRSAVKTVRLEWTHGEDTYIIINPSFDKGEPMRWSGPLAGPGYPPSVDFEACFLKGDPQETEIFPVIPHHGEPLYPLFAALEAFLFEHFTGDHYEN